MTDKFLFFIEESVNINVKRKFFIKENNKCTLSLYKFDEEDYELLNELGADDYTFHVYYSVNEDAIYKATTSKEKVVKDVITSVYLINLPAGINLDLVNNINLENLIKCFFLYAFDNNDFLFDNFLEVAEENNWYSRKEIKDIHSKNKEFFDGIDRLIYQDNFLIKYIDKDNFFAFDNM